jgi:LDH2 family malate/lactate/ureidoglycolate dehydrogenase
MDDTLRELRSSESMTADAVRLPGERAAEEIERGHRLGVPVPMPLRTQLDALADRLGVDRL